MKAFERGDDAALDLEPVARLPDVGVFGGELVRRIKTSEVFGDFGSLGSAVIPENQYFFVRVSDVVEARASDSFEEGAEVGVVQGRAEGGEFGGVGGNVGEVVVEDLFDGVVEAERRHERLEIRDWRIGIGYWILGIEGDLQGVRGGKGEVGDGEGLGDGVVLGMEGMRIPV